MFCTFTHYINSANTTRKRYLRQIWEPSLLDQTFHTLSADLLWSHLALRDPPAMQPHGINRSTFFSALYLLNHQWNAPAYLLKVQKLSVVMLHFQSHLGVDRQPLYEFNKCYLLISLLCWLLHSNTVTVYSSFYPKKEYCQDTHSEKDQFE